ncbi:MAG: multidrug effflux MFS transporter [Desulfobulbus sp.]
MRQLISALRRRFPRIILLLALLSAFPPLATDMYLAALPLLQREWGVGPVVINLTLIAFFLSYCAFLLVYGPLSDRFGRRPPLLFGSGLFAAASLLCALASNVEIMIFGRILQGAGAAAASSIVFAVAKDRFAGNQRQRVLIQIGVIVASAPMLAPIIGGWIVTLWTWRLVFLIQAVLGLAAWYGVLRMPEPLVRRSASGARQVAAGYLRLFRNRRYTALMLSFTWTCAPVFAFIAGAADLYITRMGYSADQFGYFFGFNSLAFVAAPLTFSFLVRRIATFRLIPLALVGMLAASCLLLCTWMPTPWRLTLPMLGLTFCHSFIRPVGNNLVLEQVDRDAGAASSLMVFFHFLVGALGMWAFSFPWDDKITVLGRIGLLAASCSLTGWLLVRGKIRPVGGSGAGSVREGGARGRPA